MRIEASLRLFLPLTMLFSASCLQENPLEPPPQAAKAHEKDVWIKNAAPTQKILEILQAHPEISMETHTVYALPEGSSITFCKRDNPAYGGTFTRKDGALVFTVAGSPFPYNFKGSTDSLFVFDQNNGLYLYEDSVNDPRNSKEDFIIVRDEDWVQFCYVPRKDEQTG